MTPAQLISRKRDGHELSDDQISQFVQQYTSGDVADYQMSAFAMAVYFRGMTSTETVSMTRAMLQSGTTLAWDVAENVAPCVDKHSTGGIGDKISLVLAPLLACCGLRVPMLSGRGLGITGGTLDKLEAIPGFRTQLSIAETQRIVNEVGCVITGASSELAPADRKLYALRDVTGTVPSQPLIVSSIMSKKLAENLSSLILDVKSGSGAFMKTADDARALGRALVDVGNRMGVKTSALVTNMNEPLGHAVGNANEVREAIETLQGVGPPDVRELTIRLGCELLLAEKVAMSEETAHRQLLSHITSGAAFEKFTQMIAAQGGRLDEFKSDVNANSQPIDADVAGHVHAIDCDALGNVVIELGGGRRKLADKIDHAVGLEILVHVGQHVDVGQPLALVQSRTSFDVKTLRDSFVIDPQACAKLPLILERIV